MFTLGQRQNTTSLFEFRYLIPKPLCVSLGITISLVEDRFIIRIGFLSLCDDVKEMVVFDVGSDPSNTT